MEKECPRCKVVKSLDEFHKSTRSKDGRQSYCKLCNKEIRKEYYKTAHGRAQNVTTGKRLRIKLRLRLIEYLQDKSCMDCGETDSVVFEFDHVRGEKEHTISHMVKRGFSWENILKEMAKCDIVCANCHRRRTAKQFGWAKGGVPVVAELMEVEPG